jgi:hypothetical protein
MRWLIAATIVLTFVPLARGQAVPFYYAAATLAEPEISVATSGSDLEVQRAVVSHDHKYVTLDLGTSNSSLLGFRTFSFQTGGLGFVGSSTAVAGLTPAPNQLSSGLSPPARKSLTPSIAASPNEIAPTLSVLDKPGMTLIAPLAGAVDVRK